MSAATCDQFICNAWKKDFCSNCFKAKNEHTEKIPEAIFISLPDPPKQGILRKEAVRGKKAQKVLFPATEFEVIGYGGDDVYSDDDDDIRSDRSTCSAEEPDTEQDKALWTLTKSNTDFNSVAANLLGLNSDAHDLPQLGKANIDEKGIKKTLLVPITPFGASAFNHTAKTRLDQVTDTVNECMNVNVVEAVPKAQELPDGVKTVPVEEVPCSPPLVEIAIKRSQPIDKNSRYRPFKQIEIKNKSEQIQSIPEANRVSERLKTSVKVACLIDKAKKKVHNLPVIGDAQLKTKLMESKCNDVNKGVVLDVYDISESKKNQKNFDFVEGTKNEDIKASDFIQPPDDFMKNQENLLVLDETAVKNCSNGIAQNQLKEKFCEKLEGAIDVEEISVFSSEKVSSMCEVERPAPDGEADTDPNEISKPLNEVPALDPRTSFLHQLTGGSPHKSREKPQVPAKPTAFASRKLPFMGVPLNLTQSEIPVTKVSSTDISTDTVKKRPAPKPPSPPDNDTKAAAPLRASFSSDNLLLTAEMNPSAPAPFPRRSLSLSQEELETGVSDIRKKTYRIRFSLRKLLHLGKYKEFSRETEQRGLSLPPSPAASLRWRPKPEIIHPLDDALRQCRQSTENISVDPAKNSDEVMPPPDQSIQADETDCNRTQQLAGSDFILSCRDESEDGFEGFSIAQKQVETLQNEDKKQNWIDKVCESPGTPEDSGYESVDVSHGNDSPSSSLSMNPDDNVYECVNTGRALNKTLNSGAECRSESSSYLKSENDLKPRPLRVLYGTDPDFEVYSPYSFCGSEMGEDDYEWSATSGRFQKVTRLKTKKGRSIIHKSLEDNYGAVIIANHDALAQVVLQMHQGPVASPPLRSLIASVTNLRWTHFTLLSEHGGLTVGQRAFYSALWGSQPVTLCLTPESLGSFHGHPPFSLQPLTELHDLVPAKYLPCNLPKDDTLSQCSIAVLNPTKIDSLANYCRQVSASFLSEDLQKEVYFILLLAINALKTLQASGIEEAPRDLDNVVVCRDERDPHPRIFLLPDSSRNTASLCSCLLGLLQRLPTTELSPLLEATLQAERAGSLSQAKGLLEFSLWGPTDTIFEKGSRGPALQRWLDLERASVLHGLVRTRSDLSVFEEWHLIFLVHTNAKLLHDSSIMLESNLLTTNA